MRRTLTVVLCAAAIIGGCARPAPAPSTPAPTSPPAAPASPSAPPSAPAATTPSAAPAPVTPVVLTEREKIEALLQKLAASPDTFNRNGTDYSGKDAAAHLRSKLASAGDRVKTVRQFIDGLGSTSSMSGKPYTVKKPDGTTVNAKAWFDAELALIEAAAKR